MLSCRAWSVTLICVLSLTALGFGPPVLSDGRYPPLRLYPEQIQQLRQLAELPTLSADAAVMADLDAGQTLYEWRPHEPLPPASTAKIMTALLVLQHANLADRVTVSPQAAATGDSRMGLTAGETLIVQDLLYGLLLPSGNDAAVALAEHVSGSETAFVVLMNETAADLGLAETHFANPHGLDDLTATTSAADLVTLTRAALAYPAFTQIVATNSTAAAGHWLVNTNELLRLYPGADGVKTGTTAAAGECLVASVTRRGHRLLLVLLGSADRYADATILLDYAAANWQWRPVALPADALAWQTDATGQAYRLRPAENSDLFLPAWQWPLTQPVRVLDPTVPLTGTLPVGSLWLTFNGQVLAKVPLAVWEGP
jgi:D-alanyl-D-alanine carboxypeptidase (penicillin-binding protein 5/6)